MGLYEEINITKARFAIREANNKLSDFILRANLNDNDLKILKNILGLIEYVDHSDWHMRSY